MLTARSVADVVALYRWIRNTTRCSYRQPGLTMVCDQNFRVESFTLHDPSTPFLGPPAEHWPGQKLQDHIPRFLMHLVANAAQRAVGTPHPVDIRYPILIEGVWYASHAQISCAHERAKRLIIKVRREPLAMFCRKPVRIALALLSSALWAG